MKIFSLSFALITICTLSGCSTSSGSARTRPTDQIITTANSSSGRIASVRVFKTGKTLLVTGLIRRTPGHAISAAAHIDIELLDPSGHVLASGHDRITASHPRQEQRRAGHYSFAVGFPLAVSRDATGIRVTYHPQTHS